MGGLGVVVGGRVRLYYWVDAHLFIRVEACRLYGASRCKLDSLLLVVKRVMTR
jgi:hypothetical protein